MTRARNEKKTLTVVKLGGSAITDKSQKLTPDLVTIHRAIDQIAAYDGGLVLLHGGGSFAHPFAKKAKLQNGFQGMRSQLKGVAETELYLDQLSRIISVALLLRHVDSIALKPMSFVETSNGRIAASFLQPFLESLRLGFVPLSHGDVVFDRKQGFSVLSADRLAAYLGTQLGASRILFGSDVDGIYTSDPKGKAFAEERELVRRVDQQNLRDVRAMLGSARHEDVTGGMRGKVEEILALARRGCESYVFNLRREGMLERILKGDKDLECTWFPAWR